MKNFDLYRYFREDILREQDDEEMDPQNATQNNPQAMGQDPNSSVQAPVPDDAQTQSPDQESPAKQTKMIQADKSHFSSVIGQAIDSIKFERATGNPNAGSIKIYTEKYQLPLIISWSNGRVTITKPESGEVYPLS